MMTDEELVERIEAAWKCQIIDYRADYATIDSYCVRDGQIVAHLERKTRNVTFDAYPTAIVDAYKWLALLAADHHPTAPALLAYGWQCGRVGYVQPSTTGELTIEMATPALESVSMNAGVTRPVIHIPKERFKMLPGEVNA